MKDLILSNNIWDENPYWHQPISVRGFVPDLDDLALFDQNGYDLTPIEQYYALSNLRPAVAHREHRQALKRDWFQQRPKCSGAVLNHSLLFERKAYAGEAMHQLQSWAQELPLLHKITAIRPKWGLDFSMDYVDTDGNSFEVLHWEYDGFDHNEMVHIKKSVEEKLIDIDWDHAGQEILKHKNEWHHLDFFAQSEWKCKYFGIVNERFKMVIWQ